MQKINRLFYHVCLRRKWPSGPFWSVIFLLTPVICQRVTCMSFKFNWLKNEKNVITGRTVQNAGNGVFSNLSGRNGPEGHFSNPRTSQIWGFGESDLSLREFSLLSQNARHENPRGFLEFGNEENRVFTYFRLIFYCYLLIFVNELRASILKSMC